MRQIFKNARIVKNVHPFEELKNGYIIINGKTIEEIGEGEPKIGSSDAVTDMTGKAILPGLYNMHTHLPMTLFRSTAEELPLDRWLSEKIFPAEDKLTPELVRLGSLISVAEMLASGTVSFSDMYFFTREIIETVIPTGIKMNTSRCCVCFDESGESDNGMMDEAFAIFDEFNGAGDGRALIDLSVHAVYTTNDKYLERFAKRMKNANGRFHIHLSETEKEQNECIARYGKTPAQVFSNAGFFESPGICAHCVHLTDEDMELLAKKSITAVYNPTSNLKLGSGLARVDDMLKHGMNLCIGTDGCASNNNLGMFEEMHIAALLPKGIKKDPEAMPASKVLEMATRNGAAAQGRKNSGELKEGYSADLIAIDLNKPHLMPLGGLCYSLIYSAQGADVCLTMVDGEILYKNGEFTKIDMERLTHDLKKAGL